MTNGVRIFVMTRNIPDRRLTLSHRIVMSNRRQTTNSHGEAKRFGVRSPNTCYSCRRELREGGLRPQQERADGWAGGFGVKGGCGPCMTARSSM